MPPSPSLSRGPRPGPIGGEVLRPTAAPPPAEVAAQPGYLPQLDGLRGVLASLVVVHHAYYHAWPLGSGGPPATGWFPLLSWAQYGHYAVDAFITLSGFVLTAALLRAGGLRGGALRYYAGRFWRIVPAYYASIALCVVLLLTLIGRETGTHWDISARWRWRSVLSALAFTPEWYGAGGVNHVYWSVAVEAKIFLVFPLIALLVRRAGLLATGLGIAATAMIGSQIVRAADGPDLWFWHQSIVWYYALFATGMLAAGVALGPDPRWSRWRRLPWGLASLAGALALLALAYGQGFEAVMSQIDLVDFLVGLTVGSALIALVARRGPATRLLSSRPLVWVGTFAYSLYLVHAPCLQLVQQYLIFPFRLSRAGQFVAVVLVGYPCIVVASYAFHRLFERPFLPRRRLAAEAEALRGSGLAA